MYSRHKVFLKCDSRKNYNVIHYVRQKNKIQIRNVAVFWSETTIFQLVRFGIKQRKANKQMNLYSIETLNSKDK